MIELVLGGIRSGKSAYAEQQAGGLRARVVYVATAQTLDSEMAQRVATHQARRPTTWRTVEAPLGLAETLRAHAAPDTCLLVDCLTLWLSNLFFAGAAARQAEAGERIDCALLSAEVAGVLEGLPTLPGHIVLVSNEVGWSIVPMHAVSRRFADEQGCLNQRIAALSQRVTLVAAGLPLTLKPAGK